jgi:uncharacterized protein
VLVALYCIAVLFAGGLLKGVVGLGLPLVGVPLLSFALGLGESVGLLVLPIVASNFAQSFTKGLFVPVVRRFWPLLSVLFVVAMFSCRALNAIPEQRLFVALGVALVVFPTVAWLRPSIRIVPRHESWAGPVAGAVAGLLGGISNLPGPPLMIYLACLRLPKDEFVVAVSLMFLTSAVALGLGLLAFNGITATELALSAAACLPVFAGMWIGNHMRVKLSERMFAGLVLLTYLLTGVTFLMRAW